MLGLEIVSPMRSRRRKAPSPSTPAPTSKSPDGIEAIDRLADRMCERSWNAGRRGLFEDFELPLVPVLARMEHAGIGVDREYLEEMGQELRHKLSVNSKRGSMSWPVSHST
jgi:DNA polymerase I-like protein with 3'-5' exonuclease and polymerase domains